MRFLLSILTLLALVMPARATDHNAADSARDTVQALHDDAGTIDGDRIIVPVGTNIVLQPLVITKGIEIIFGGTNASSRTLWLDEIAGTGVNQSTSCVIRFDSVLDKKYRVTGIHIKGGAVTRTPEWTGGTVRFTGTSKSIQFDHNIIETTQNRLMYVKDAALPNIEYNAFYMAGQQVIAMFSDAWPEDGAWGTGWRGNGSWYHPWEMGSTNAIYVRYNTIVNTINDKTAITDGFGGARFVFAYNIAYNCYPDCHGTGSSGDYRGTRTFEFNGNIFYFSNGLSFNPVIDLRSGSGVLCSNLVYLSGGSTASSFAQVNDYRQGSSFAYWGGADGTNGFDTNDLASGNVYTGTASGPGGSVTTYMDVSSSSPSIAEDALIGLVLVNTNDFNTGASTYGLPTHGLIQSNKLVSGTMRVYYVSASQAVATMTFSNTVPFTIKRVFDSLDECGFGAGDLMTNRPPIPRWLNQTADEKVWAWNNAIDGDTNAATIKCKYPSLVEGVNFTNQTALTGYTPLGAHPMSVWYGVSSGSAVVITVTGNSQAIADGSTTPSLDNHTGFGSVDTNLATLTRTYTILNGGTNTANIGTVTLSGAQAAAFTVIDQPDSTIAAGGSTTFQVRFDPSSLGLNEAEVSFSTDDPVANPFNFAIEGNGVDGAAAEIVVLGNSTEITDGDGTPSTSDDTDFGPVSAGYYSEAGLTVDTRTIIYTVENTGNSTLTLGTVTVGGTHAADFVVSAQPASSVAASSSTTFSVTFTPGATGTRSATLSFTTSDSDENPFNFSIQGTGVTPNIAVTGNGNGISSGDSTPNESDYSGFGSTIYDHTPVSHAFVITNSGTQTLEITSVAIAGSARFSISVEPDVLVSASGTTSFTLAFVPTGLGTEQATVLISTNDPDTPLYSFAIEGTGIGGNRGVPYGGRIIRR